MRLNALKNKISRRLCALVMTLFILFGAVTVAFAGGVMGTPSGKWNNSLIHRVNLDVSPTDFTFYLTENSEQFSFEILFSAQKAAPDFYGKILTASLSGLDYDYLAWMPTGLDSTPSSPRNAVLPVIDGIARTWSWYASYTFTATAAKVYELSFDISFISGKKLENSEEHLLSVPITVTVVDKRGIQPAIDAAQLVTSFEYYTAASVSEYNRALAAANALLETSAVASQEEINKAISDLNAAVSGLTYQSADYTALDEALDRVPADLSDYSPASASRVTTAVNAVDRTKKVFEQDDVDAMTTQINSAVDALVPQNFRLILPEDAGYALSTDGSFLTAIPEGATVLTGLTSNFGTVQVVPSANGVGTGTAVNIIYKENVVKTVLVAISGDVDGDADADADDFQLLMQMSVKQVAPSAAQIFAGDLNGDTVIDAIDAATHALTFVQ